MSDPADWRLMGQEKYLLGVDLIRRSSRQYAKNPGWDHDHCAFCTAKFMLGDMPDALQEGYCTLNGYYWICMICFDDFRERFGWRVLGAADGP
jgi:hypothetical protein